MRPLRWTVTLTALLLALATAVIPLAAQNPQKVKTSAVVWKQEPEGFKSAKFGASRSDVGFMSEQEWLAEWRADPATYQKDHCFGEYLGAERCKRIDEIGDIGITFTYYFRDGKLVEIDGSFSAKNYEQLRELFVETYGRPHQSQHTVERTALGVTVHDESLQWTGKRVSVFITKYLGNINDGVFSVSLKSEDVVREQIKRETKKKAVESLK